MAKASGEEEHAPSGKQRLTNNPRVTSEPLTHHSRHVTPRFGRGQRGPAAGFRSLSGGRLGRNLVGSEIGPEKSPSVE